ncbi:hypothetical protein A5733_14945 [Mycobacterium sp. NS-7484]|uniref:hypothetical protein n=1 Tax=unclassified Mycobacterium TaxID=2642494 RepID=UPI00080100AA|nr:MULTISPECIES: hypothetical protein [unclassified Mycobacterium]OBG82603.1 hypothetical protein A5699_05460 [Mycobacterium sp. E802]OMB94451.1 hypothetical protein A5733_14945 [Mycobacterium sp. NS-7484]
MTDRVELLSYAEQVLDGTVRLGVRGPRTAALLARCAFEDWLDEMSAPWATQAETDRPPTTSSKLVALGALHGNELGEQAKTAWNGLSRAVHHHAYELQPSVTEVRYLVRLVRDACTGSGPEPAGPILKD